MLITTEKQFRGKSGTSGVRTVLTRSARFCALLSKRAQF